MTIAKMQGNTKVVNMKPTPQESKREITPKLITPSETVREDP
jgi:hypothetical protein